MCLSLLFAVVLFIPGSGVNFEKGAADVAGSDLGSIFYLFNLQRARQADGKKRMSAT
jgi:hypothetical protein